MTLLCYTYDPEAKTTIDAEIDRMVAAIKDFWLKKL